MTVWLFDKSVMSAPLLPVSQVRHICGDMRIRLVGQANRPCMETHTEEQMSQRHSKSNMEIPKVMALGA